MIINEVLTPLVVGAVYLALWAAVSETVDHDRALGKLAMHPISIGLALGVYATSWTFFGSVGYAQRFGYDFLAISMGVLLSCLAIPVIWAPLARLVHRHNFSSVADLIAYRYQSQVAGMLITAFMLLSMLPYISLQIRSVSETAHFLAGDQAPEHLGLVYAIILGSFAVALGARYADPRAQRPGLIATLAGESLVKLFAISVLGVATLYGHFDGLAGVDAFLTAHPEKLEHMFSPVRDLGWVSLLLVAFFAAFLLPRQFHVAFVESRSPRALRHAMWVLPLLLLLINLPLPLLYWAGEAKFAGSVAPDRYVLAVADGPLLRLLTFIGGLSASSAMLLVSSMALSAMVVNHAVIPAWGHRDLSYARLVQMRRLVVAALVVSGFVFHSLMPRAGSLVDLGLVSFAAVLQLAPGVLGALFWPRGTRRGLVLGICGGTLIWVVIIAMPLLGLEDPVELGYLLGIEANDPRSSAIWLSVAVNGLLYALGSLSGRQRDHEAAAAASCTLGQPLVKSPPPSVAALRAAVEDALGAQSAALEVEHALATLDLEETERRPLELRRLSDVIERNLSELVGPLAAHAIVTPASARTYEPDDVAEQLRFLSQRAERMGDARPTGLERSFELVRQYFSDVLGDLPLGVCTIAPTGEVLVWNHMMTRLTGIEDKDILGAQIDEVGQPWGELLNTALHAAPGEPRERTVSLGGAPGVDERIVAVTRALIQQQGDALLIEDLTQQRAMQSQLAHQDRLSSVGRFAAGVAHEIGNPLAGVLMVAQNMQRELTGDEDTVHRLGLIVHESRRIEEIIGTLLQFSRNERVVRKAAEPTELGAIVDDALRLVKLSKRGRDVQWVVEVPEEAVVIADGQRIAQVLVNLMSNAQDVSADGDLITVRASAAGSYWAVEVLDQGPGVPQEARERIFEPFFTTKAPGSGTGLGLAISYWIAREHDGQLACADAPDGGAVFTLTLPRPEEDDGRSEQE